MNIDRGNRTRTEAPASSGTFRGGNRLFVAFFDRSINLGVDIEDFEDQTNSQFVAFVPDEKAYPNNIMCIFKVSPQ